MDKCCICGRRTKLMMHKCEPCFYAFCYARKSGRRVSCFGLFRA